MLKLPVTVNDTFYSFLCNLKFLMPVSHIQENKYVMVTGAFVTHRTPCEPGGAPVTQGKHPWRSPSDSGEPFSLRKSPTSIHFHPSLIFVGKDESLPIVRSTARASTLVGSGFAWK